MAELRDVREDGGLTEPARILMIDDELELLRATSRLLGREGYDVIEAETGADGLRLAEEERPDLMLIDVVLPDVDGVEVCKRIKADPALADCYVVLFSSLRTESEARARGLEAGADDYIARPITNRELLARIQAMLRLKQAQQALKENSQRLEELVEERTQALLMANQKLAGQERLAALGQLAGGVGHELRNPMAAIKNAAYYLKVTLSEATLVDVPAADLKEVLAILEKEVKAAEWIINSLLEFARPKQAERRPVNVNALIVEALSHNRVPGNVEVVQQLDDTLPAIVADPDQLSLVLGNLIVNATQAMPNGGWLRVRTWLEKGDDKGEAHKGRDSIAISVSDTGVGIAQENLDKLFEPLFTTKPKGIGLGLALVKMLVENHNGGIEVRSPASEALVSASVEAEGREVGAPGSDFTVWLPVDGEVEG